MAKILVNDGLHNTGLLMIQAAGHEVIKEKIPQHDLHSALSGFDVICVRSATQVRKPEIDAGDRLKAICRAGVGLDNIDVKYASQKGIAVINTPGASSRSVAELALGHMIAIARSLHLSNRTMPETGARDFSRLKKAYSGGFELYGRTLGLIGFGRIGQETAKTALGIGMKVVATDPYVDSAVLHLGNDVFDMDYTVKTTSLGQLLVQSDIISLHLPFSGQAVISKNEINQMKDGVVIINCARGGLLDEDALLEGLNSGKILAAGLDVFENEPTPHIDLLRHANVSVSPHIGAATVEAQERIGVELAEQLLDFLNKQ